MLIEFVIRYQQCTYVHSNRAKCLLLYCVHSVYLCYWFVVLCYYLFCNSLTSCTAWQSAKATAHCLQKSKNVPDENPCAKRLIIASRVFQLVFMKWMHTCFWRCLYRTVLKVNTQQERADVRIVISSCIHVKLSQPWQWGGQVWGENINWRWVVNKALLFIMTGELCLSLFHVSKPFSGH